MLGSKLFFLLAHGLLHAIAKNVRPESHGHPHHLRNANLVERQVGAGLGVEEQLQAHANATLVKRREPTYGLSDSNLKIGDISVGFLPGFGEALGPNNATVINEILPKPMSIIGLYCAIEDSGPNWECLDYHLPELLQQKKLFGGDNPILQVALMPVDGFKPVDRAMTYRIANRMKEVNDQGVTVWLRYAHEFNGDWYAWGGQPEAFLQSWKLLTRAIRAVTTDTYMLWSPNSRFRDIDAAVGGYTPYWPGAAWVDLVGLSLYSYGGYERLNIAPPENFVSSQVAEFDALFGSKQKKHIVLSETASSYATNLDTGKPNDPSTGAASEYEIKTQYWEQLLDKTFHAKVPYFKAITWFEIIKEESATGDTPVRQMDFRSLMGKKGKLANAVLKMLSS